MRIRVLATTAGLLLLGCASAPALRPGEAGLWGTVQLVPHEGAPQGSGAYGDRRLRDVERFDYSRPGFVVVFLRGEAARDEARLEIVDEPMGARITPRHAAVGAAGVVVVENRSGDPHTVSCPRAGVVTRLEPGASARIQSPGGGGELAVHLLESDREPARVFAVPGPYDVVDSAGHFEIRSLEPGAVTLETWHPRLPPVRRELLLEAGRATRVDLSIGVGLDGGDRASR